MIDRVCTDIKIANNTRSNHIMGSLLIITMLFLLTDSPQNLILEKFHDALTILFCVSPSSPLLQSHFKENFKVSQKRTTLQQVTGGKIPNLVLNRMLKLFLKIPLLKKILEFQD